MIPSMFVVSPEHFIPRDFQALAARRQAAVLLAARLYRLDRGAAPTKLDQLVPAYLAEIPANPMEPGKPLLLTVPPRQNSSQPATRGARPQTSR